MGGSRLPCRGQEAPQSALGVWLAGVGRGVNRVGAREIWRGGYLPSRWRDGNGYDNPTVYCDDIKDIFRHIRERVGPTLYVN